ncbi:MULTISPECIES: hypothetical protein [unclassified Bradyrhizobium]|uniref:hypothetical protein n=1 Tax=unclassified Bradyrhizobium TaxID=2631580 RepID=UPI001FFB701D|nr:MULTISPECIES: hypothetical protein [unclassified Bradyrhizobium]MCK1713897.1 hypothetical protein [Bradyrhizobium sp. 143]MCK1728945.1 hypothetical protein [Bradyrhizobium sp. 142]
MDEATNRGTVYPWQCDHVGHMNIIWHVGKLDRQARRSTPFADAIRETAMKRLVERAEA